MGEVYRARDTRLGRDVAIKVLPQHLNEYPEVHARFERETLAQRLEKVRCRWPRRCGPPSRSPTRSTAPTAPGSSTQPLFRVSNEPGSRRNVYDVSPDGKRFLLVVPASERSTRMTVVGNWRAGHTDR